MYGAHSDPGKSYAYIATDGGLSGRKRVQMGGCDETRLLVQYDHHERYPKWIVSDLRASHNGLCGSTRFVPGPRTLTSIGRKKPFTTRNQAESQEYLIIICNNQQL